MANLTLLPRGKVDGVFEKPATPHSLDPILPRRWLIKYRLLKLTVLSTEKKVSCGNESGPDC